MALYDQNWDINSYNRAYGNNNLDARFQGENEIYRNMDQNMNYRPPGSFLRSGVGSFYNTPQTYPGSPYSPHRGFEEMQFDKIDETVTPERTGIMETIKGWTTPTMEFLKKMGGVTPEKKAFYDAIVGERPLRTGQWTKGMYGGNEYEVANTRGGLKVGSDIIGKGPGFEKNLYSAFGSKSIEEMEQKKLDWALARYNKMGRKGLGTRIYNELAKSGMIDDQIRTGADTVAPVRTDRQKIEAYTGRPMSEYRASRPASERQFTGHGRSGMGRSADRFAAEGGRIGYQDGELVEDESMFAATPQGMMEENIEEVQGEPTREQLEAIALEIFRLPLEQLNEEQLNVVYQAAMEQEPAEEEIQFAAQEGPGEGIASLV